MGTIPSPKTLGSLLGGLRAFTWIQAWKEACGPAIAQQTRFLGVHERDGKLCVCLGVSDPLWRQELEHQRGELLHRFQQALERRGLSSEEWPQDCLLTASNRMPFQSRYPQKSWKKKGI